MNSVELLLLNLGFSFTMAKFIPYVLLLLLGWFLGRFVYRKIQQKTPKRWLQALVFIGFFIQPVLIYFALFPVYQGDLFDLSYHPTTKLTLKNRRTMVVIALPGCKYCSESTVQMRAIQPYVKSHIEYWVLGSDAMDLKSFQGMVGPHIKVRLIPDIKSVLPLTEGSFPTYLLIEKGKISKAWHNDSFGIRALETLD